MAGNGAGLRSGQVAEMTGVSPDTIRHYERIGILPHPPRSSGGYRLYSAEVIERVHLVQRALQLGFTLAELAEILTERDKGGVPCRRVLNLAEENLHSLERQIAELRQTHTYMKSLVRQWRAKLAQTEPGAKALLLHSLIDDDSSPPHARKKLRRRQ
jgi:MerR family transcriptional regulator, copper efflux regulator